ncbi:MAG TPA: hypothetical protein VF020_15880 [Chthoniobacterales bacterium]
MIRVYSAAVVGAGAFEVEVEVQTGWGEEGKVTVVGLPDTAVRESKDRAFSHYQYGSALARAVRLPSNSPRPQF